jgi:hypothetical protein
MPRTRSLGYGLVGSSTGAVKGHGPKGNVNNGGGKGKGNGPGTNNQGGNAAPPEPPVPNWSNVSLLMGFDGAFTDESGANATVTNGGAVDIDATNKEFGYGSASWDGTTAAYLSLPPNVKYVFGTGSWTMDLWVRPAIGGINQNTVMLDLLDAGFQLGANSDGNSTTKTVFLNVANAQRAGFTWTPVAGTWYFFRACFDSATGKFRLFLDGVLKQSTTSTPTVGGAAANLIIGNQADFARPWYGNIDEVRILKGICLNTVDTTFTPPTSPAARESRAPVYGNRRALTNVANTLFPNFASQATPPTFSSIGTTLPSGLSINTTTGQVEGMASAAGATTTGHQIRMVSNGVNYDSDVFSITTAVGYGFYLLEFITTGNTFIGASTIKLLVEGNPVDRAAQSRGGIATANYTVNGSFPVTNVNDGNDSTFTTSTISQAGVGKGITIQMTAIRDIKKLGYRTRSDSFGANEALVTGKIWGKPTSGDALTLLVTLPTQSLGSNQYVEFDIY